MVSKVFNKNFGEKKLLNMLFSIKMENKIYNSLSTEVFVSPCVYKLIIYVYIFSHLEPALHNKRSVWSWIRTCALQARHTGSRNRSSYRILKLRSIFFVHIWTYLFILTWINNYIFFGGGIFVKFLLSFKLFFGVKRC